MATIISNCSHDERGAYKYGKAGDQTGEEWRLREWYNRPWNYVFYHPDNRVNKLMAELGRKAAENDKIGYDQEDDRTSYFMNLKKVGYDPAKITEPCEADCSSGVASNVYACGKLLGYENFCKEHPGNIYSGNMRKWLTSIGFKCLTASKYLVNSDYLGIGWILLYEGHHTATNITQGSKYVKPDDLIDDETVFALNLPLTKYGDTGAAVVTLQRMLKGRNWKGKGGKTLKISGVFDDDTLYAFKNFQKRFPEKCGEADGKCGRLGWAALFS